MSTTPRVAFLGIGLMGSRQARRLLAAGFPVTAWNRSRDKAEALVADGATVADDAGAAVAGADVVVVMLERGSAVAEVLFERGVREAAKPGAIVVDMSSIKPAEAQEHARRLAERGVHHLDAPVSGGTGGAESGTLAIMVGGEPAVFDRAAPVLATMGRATLVGPSGAGQLAKLANQIIVGATIGAVAEALLLAERGGADPAKVCAAIAGGFAQSTVLDVHAPRMIARDFATRGRTVTHLKDIDNALDAAAGIGVEMPFSALTGALMRDLVEHQGDCDHSGLFLEIARRSDAA